MPLLQTSGNVTADGYGGGVAAVPNYIEDVFSTYLYTGTGASQTITNGIDLSTKGGLVWTKTRSGGAGYDWHVLVDSARGVTKVIETNLTDAEATQTDLTSFTTTGYNLAAGSYYGNFNLNNAKFVSWTFRKQPKFFDVVTYTGNGVDGRQIAHNLGSVPGCVIIKRTDAADNWYVCHRSITTDGSSGSSAKYLLLNSTVASQSDAQNIFGNEVTVSYPTSTVFTVSNWDAVNRSGGTYVAYLFAHNAGGFGLTGTDNVISCGSFTTDGSGNFSVNLGYEPQWVMIKSTNNTGVSAAQQNWIMMDNMRGFVTQSGTGARLRANTSEAESTTNDFGPTATGFESLGNMSASAPFIYIAIRRGPMKVPTSGTSVFYPQTRTANGAITSITGIGFPPDMVWSQRRDASGNSPSSIDKLRGPKQVLLQNDTMAEATSGSTYDVSSFDQNGVTVQAQGQWSVINYLTAQDANWYFKRAPSFFDEVCYTTGAGTGQTTFNHNLTVTPELVISKVRSAVDDWYVYAQPLGTSKTLYLNSNVAQQGFTCTDSLSSTQAKTYLGVGSATAVSYLFATCAGVSKVGSYTGNGSTQTINCGFTGGARFVLIKRTDSTGDWYVYDTARGMTVLTDPYLLLNSTAAESATLGSVTTVSTGFAVNASILAAINTNAASYIFLAIA